MNADGKDENTNDTNAGTNHTNRCVESVTLVGDGAERREGRNDFEPRITRIARIKASIDKKKLLRNSSSFSVVLIRVIRVIRG